MNPGTPTAAKAPSELPFHERPTLKLDAPGAPSPDSLPLDLEARSEATEALPEGEVRARPAALWRRLGAWLVDVLAVGLVVGLYLLVASAISGAQVPASDFGWLDALVTRVRTHQAIVVPGVVLAALLALVYCALFAFLWQGRTPGRWVFRIRLVDRSGTAPTPTRALVRALLSTFSFAFFLGGFWLALFDRQGQTLHDKLTSTFVVQLT